MLFAACGIENAATLQSHGLSASIADTIVTLNVLCCVPAQKSTCKFLYSLLKPGGQWLLYEHVAVEPQYRTLRLLQNIYDIMWPFVLGGCHINRDTADSLKRAGSWEKVDLGRKKGEVGREMIGHIAGKLIKEHVRDRVSR